MRAIIVGMSAGKRGSASARPSGAAPIQRIRARGVFHVDCAQALHWWADEKRLSEAFDVLAGRIRKPIVPIITREHGSVTVEASWTTSAGIEVHFTTRGHPPFRSQASGEVEYRTTMTTRRTFPDGTTSTTEARTVTTLVPAGRNTEVRHERTLIGETNVRRRLQRRLLATYFIRRDLREHARQCEKEAAASA